MKSGCKDNTLFFVRLVQRDTNNDTNTYNVQKFTVWYADTFRLIELNQNLILKNLWSGCKDYKLVFIRLVQSDF